MTAPERLPDRVKGILRAEEVKTSAVLLGADAQEGSPECSGHRPDEMRYVTRSSVEVLPIRVAHIDRLDELTGIHDDLFDRMLVAQAQCTLVTADATLFRYGVPAVWE